MTTTTTTAAPTSATTTFVEQLYAQFLQRSAGAGEAAYWTEQIDSGRLDAAQVSQQFLASAEFKQAVDPVVRLYFAAFGHVPDAGGLAYWVNAMHNGMTAQQAGALFAGSPEFAKMYDSVDDTAFIDAMYHSAFKRAPDAGGQAFWLDKLSHGASRTDVLVTLSNSPEMVSATGSTVAVVSDYLGVLNTAPTAAQIAAALSEVDPLALITKLYASPEYKGATVPFLSQSGVVADGYVKGATVTLTTVKMIDGVATTQVQTTTTDAQGHFDFGTRAGFGTLVQTGGTDIATGAAVNGSYTALAGSKVINPLTTLVQALAADGKHSAAEAETLVKAKLGIDASVHLGSYDAILEAGKSGASAADQAAALKVQAVLAQVNTAMGQIGAVLGGAGVSSSDAGANAAIKAIANLIGGSDASVDLAAGSTTSALVKAAAAAAGASTAQAAIIDTLAADAGKVIAQLNHAIADAANAATGDAKAHLVAMAQVQVAAEAIETSMASGAHDGTLGSSVSAVDSAALAQAIAHAAATVGDVNGDKTSDAVLPPAPAPAPAPSVAPTFVVTVANGTASFSGSATGDIGIAFGTDGAAVFSRGGITDTHPVTGLHGTFVPPLTSLVLASGQTLAGNAADLNGMRISGPGAVHITAEVPATTVDFSSIYAASVTFAVNHDLTLTDGRLGMAVVTVAAGATLSVLDYIASGATITGPGSVNLQMWNDEPDLSHIHVGGGLNLVVADHDRYDISQNATTGAVSSYAINDSEGRLTMTAAQLDHIGISGIGSVRVLGSEGAQQINVAATGYNQIAGGAGADLITLGAGHDVLDIAFGAEPVAQQDTIVLGARFEAGDTVQIDIGGRQYVAYRVTAADIAAGGQVLEAIAIGVAGAINGGTGSSAMVTATAAGGTINLVAKAGVAPFEVSSSVNPHGNFYESDTIKLSGVYEVGDQIHIGANGGVDVNYTVQASDLLYNGAAATHDQALNNVVSHLAQQLATYTNPFTGALAYSLKIGSDSIMMATNGVNVFTTSATNAAPVPAVAQRDTLALSGTYEAGDSISLTLGGTELKYVVTAADVTDPATAVATVAANLAAAINASAAAAAVTATAVEGNVSVIADVADTPFVLDGHAINRPVQDQIDTVTLSGTYEVGDTITVDIGAPTGSPSYTVTADDLTAVGGGVASAAEAITNIASHLSAALHASHPSEFVSSQGEVVTIHQSLTPVTINVHSDNRAAHGQTDSVTLSGAYEAGDSVTVTVNDTEVSYTVDAADLTASGGGAATGAEALANIAAKLGNAVSALEATTHVMATYANAVVTLTASVAGASFTLATSSANRAPVAQQDTVTLSGTYNEGDTVTVTIDGHAATYTVVAGDALEDIALGLQSAIETGTGAISVTVSIAPVGSDQVLTLVATTAGTPLAVSSDTTLGTPGGAAAAHAISVPNVNAGVDEQQVDHALVTAAIQAGADNFSFAGHATTQPYVAGGADTQVLGHTVVKVGAPAVAGGADNTQAITNTTTSPFIPANTGAPSATVDLDSHVASVRGAESNLAGMDVVTGFQLGVDQIELTDGLGNLLVVNSIVQLAAIASSNNLAASLSVAFNGAPANEARMVDILAGSAQGTYLFVNDADATYSATSDVFIKLVGTVGTGAHPLALSDFFSNVL